MDAESLKLTDAEIRVISVPTLQCDVQEDYCGTHKEFHGGDRELVDAATAKAVWALETKGLLTHQRWHANPPDGDIWCGTTCEACALLKGIPRPEEVAHGQTS